MKIGNLNLTGRVLCAPLAGVSSRPFRLLALRYGASAVFTEMVSAEAIIRHQERTRAMMRFQSDEQPLGIQLFGANPRTLEEAARIAVTDFAPDLVDINFGCPVKKVVNKNGGGRDSQGSRPDRGNHRRGRARRRPDAGNDKAANRLG